MYSQFENHFLDVFSTEMHNFLISQASPDPFIPWSQHRARFHQPVSSMRLCLLCSLLCGVTHGLAPHRCPIHNHGKNSGFMGFPTVSSWQLDASQAHQGEPMKQLLRSRGFLAGRQPQSHLCLWECAYCKVMARTRIIKDYIWPLDIPPSKVSAH